MRININTQGQVLFHQTIIPQNNLHHFDLYYTQYKKRVRYGVQNILKLSTQNLEDAELKVAVIGSRGLTVDNLQEFLPADTDEIVSGGAAGIDTSAAQYAREKGLRLTEFLPDYAAYGRAAPIKRNDQIIAYCDRVVAFWDGSSRGTQYVITQCKKLNKPIQVFMQTPP